MVMELQPELLEIQLGQLMAPPVSHAGAPCPPKCSLLRTSGLGLLQHQSQQVEGQSQHQTQEEETIVCCKPNDALMQHSHSPMDRPQLHLDPPRQKV